MLFASNFRPSHHLNSILRGDILCIQPLWIFLLAGCHCLKSNPWPVAWVEQHSLGTKGMWSPTSEGEGTELRSHEEEPLFSRKPTQRKQYLNTGNSVARIKVGEKCGFVLLFWHSFCSLALSCLCRALPEVSSKTPCNGWDDGGYGSLSYPLCHSEAGGLGVPLWAGRA